MEEEKKNEQEEIVEEATEVVDGEPFKEHFSFPWRGFLIVFGVLITLIVVCVVVILLNGGFYQW